MAIKHMRLFCVAALVLLMTGCNAAQQRGMLGSAYVHNPPGYFLGG